MRYLPIALVLVVAVVLTGCASPKGDTGDSKRQAILSTRDDTLAKLYQQKPETRAEVEKAAGYAVFSNVGLTVLFIGAGEGYGVVVENGSGKQTYMKMAQVSAALGLGLKDFRAVFVFEDQATLQKFVDKGWEFGGEADAGLKSGEKGGEAAVAGTVRDKLRIYQFTESGIALKASVPLTKYRKYDELN